MKLHLLIIVSKACLSLKEPYFLRKPSAKLVGKDRAAAVARVLAEFLSQYTRYSTVQYNTVHTVYTTLHQGDRVPRPGRGGHGGEGAGRDLPELPPPRLGSR